MDYGSLSPQDLVRECARTGSTAAWEEFIFRYDRRIGGTIRRKIRYPLQPSQATVEDSKQDVYLKLCVPGNNLLKSLAATENEAAFIGLLMVSVANLMLDHCKALYAQKRGSGKASEDLEKVAAAGASGGAGDMDAAILHGELDDALLALGYSEDERSVYWKYYRDGLTAAQVAGLPTAQLSEKGVGSLLTRMNHDLREWLVKTKKRN